MNAHGFEILLFEALFAESKIEVSVNLITLSNLSINQGTHTVRKIKTPFVSYMTVAASVTSDLFQNHPLNLSSFTLFISLRRW